jgi:hypothetical protein
MKKNPTFKHPALEALADSMLKGEDRRLLLLDKTPLLLGEHVDVWRGLLKDKEEQVEALKKVIAFNEVANILCPDGVEVDYHEEEQ